MVTRAAAVAVGVLASTMAHGASSAIAGDAPPLAYEPAEERVTVSAREVPLPSLLRALGRRAGFEVVLIDTGERPISIDVHGAPLAETLERLLARENFVLEFAERDDGRLVVSRVLVLGPRSRGAGVVPHADPDEDARSVLPEDADRIDPDGPIELLQGFADHRDPGTRTVALEALSARGHDPRARQALIEHVADPDPRVRAVAVGLLGAYLSSPRVEDAVATALRDPSPRVRQLAVRVLSEAGSRRARSAIDLALQDEHPIVRAVAREVLSTTGEDTPDE
ncbi:MAG: HEAT repeat domain-containing protein [Candidatus Rokubacteria bacterium]|nr:HEAT repeat domain-containing protein [Candidatus Rokubacteria bacterium]